MAIGVDSQLSHEAWGTYIFMHSSKADRRNSAMILI